MLLRIWDVTFSVSDLQRSVYFYEHVLGLDKKYQFETYAGFDCGGVEIGLAPGRQADPAPDAPCIDFLVDDVDEACRTLRERGVTFVKEPEDTQWGGRIARFSDPNGHILQLLEIDWPAYLEACAS